MIIPTRNQAVLLDRALRSIALQDLPEEQFEVIVVDNGSTDTTAKICETWSSKFSHFRSVYASEPGLHVGRNLGMQLAQADIVVYTDDDIKAEPSWLESIVEAFEDANVGLVGGNSLPDYETAPPLWLEGLKQHFSFGWAIPPLSLLDFGIADREVSWTYVWGCNYSIRKQLLFEIGGFHPDGMPPDLMHLRGDGESYVSSEVIRRGKCVRFTPGATIHHFTPISRMTATYMWERGFRQGISKTYSTIRRFGRLGFREATALWISIIKSGLASCGTSNEGKKSLLNGYIAGIRWHMRHCRSNADTLAWILKSDYMTSKPNRL